MNMSIISTPHKYRISFFNIFIDERMTDGDFCKTFGGKIVEEMVGNPLCYGDVVFDKKCNRCKQRKQSRTYERTLRKYSSFFLSLTLLDSFSILLHQNQTLS